MSYARKAVGSVQSIAHGPAGTCSKLLIRGLIQRETYVDISGPNPCATWRLAPITPPPRITVKIHTEILALAGRTNIRQFIHIE